MEGERKMKKISLAIIAFIVINVIIYGMFSFVMWDFNPAHWGEVTRIIFSLISFGLSSFSGLAILSNY